MRKRVRILAILTGIFLLPALPAAPVLANSAQSWWEGTDGSGVIVTGESSPVVVERETLTFDIQEFPDSYYQDVEAFLAYSGRVTAAYTFYNPSDYTVTARLLFPFGNRPDYDGIYDESSGERLYGMDTEKYDITIEGEPVEKTVRHSLSLWYKPFDLEENLALLADDYIQDDFYNPQLTVTGYTYRADQVNLEAYGAATAAFDIEKGLEDIVYYLPGQSGQHIQDGERLRVETGIEENGELFTVYVLGEHPPAAPEWKFYEDGGAEDGEEIEGTMTLEGTETMTLREFALRDWNKQSGVSEMDWYNAVVSMMQQETAADDYPVVSLERYAWGLEENLMRWYEYELVIGPGERLVNEVTAPLYPSIDLVYEPPVYGYTYLLSPAKTWSEFGELEIVINTPYYLVESGIEGFEKEGEGYVLRLDGLPDGELEFTLSASQEPERPGNSAYILTFGVLAAVPVILILLAAGGAILVWRRRKGKKGKS